MFLDSFINYLKPSNASRITGLSIHDPFALAGFIMLLFLIPIALILLTVTARRSAESVWDGLTIDARFRDLRRSARRSMADAPRSAARQSYRSNRATRGTQRVSFMLPGIPESPRTPRTPGSTAPQRIAQTVSTPRTPATPYTPSTPHTPGQVTDTTPFLEHSPGPPTPPTDRPRVSIKPTPRLSDLPLRANYDFTDVYERHRATQQPPRINVLLEEDESKRRWTSEFQDELRMTAREMV
ncbi:hypothetical protein LTS10_010135 [Elasticomyces elasticus]|nr:hypothetical protein LTS10_010135 [Elasticomyces elasticus]